ncbi:hypothetical protein [Ruegeria atlantica]|uniref:Uncharacterized protein n=1 Tax=Ruegeria atlantica TaxID=81569 RepID=A0A0P1EIZ4_9RHOB|nr:hypothetical protein [Ruegeria atlantica]CUH50337.1 hypothetical protein RUA4292_04545 [Ruegeria atlantica]
MNTARFISLSEANTAACGMGIRELRMKRNEKGSAMAVDAVYTYAPTQPQDAQALGLIITREKLNTHGVRTNG